MSTPTTTLNFVKGIQALAGAPLYSLGSDGMVSRIHLSAEFLGSCDSLFATAFSDARTGIANVLPNTHIWGNKKSSIVFRHLAELSFKTGWRKDEAGNWTPMFQEASREMQANPALIGANATFTWDIKPLAKEGIWCILCFDTATSQVYLAFEALYPDEKCKWLRPPFGNIYDDGRVCMGTGFTTNGEFTKLPLTQKLLNITANINDSTWNNDLLQTPMKTLVQKIFRFNGDKVNTITPKEQADLIRAEGQVISTPLLTSISEACDALGL